MTKEIVTNDILLFMAVILAPFGVELIKTNLWGGLAVCLLAGIFVFVRTFFKIETANKAAGRSN
ncbi:MAG: hypothetical protein PHQ35_10585 [Phycisphaerae bacterium]|nr:hypothetical protein [Phycisphaerae bacterium]